MNQVLTSFLAARATCVAARCSEVMSLSEPAWRWRERAASAIYVYFQHRWCTLNEIKIVSAFSCAMPVINLYFEVINLLSLCRDSQPTADGWSHLAVFVFGLGTDNHAIQCCDLSRTRSTQASKTVSYGRCYVGAGGPVCHIKNIPLDGWRSRIIFEALRKEPSVI